jgi:curved DNA-binding protein
MEFKDYYKIMGVGREATQDEIKRAYRKLARKYHPDVSKDPEAEIRFKELGEANAVLKDIEKRAAYDRLGADWKAGQDFHPPPEWNAGFEFSGNGAEARGAEDFSDFFESLYGQGFAGGSRGRAEFHARGEDRHAKVMIDLGDAYSGATRVITLGTPVVDANGRVSMRSHKLNVTIPRGVRAGQHIRLGGQGGPGIGQGKAGDLYLEVAFNPHANFRVEQRDVYLDLPLAPWEAALGATIRVPTPNATVEMKIPPNSKSGGKLRLKGRGIPGNTPGDLYVVLQVALPPVDSEADKALYVAMAGQFESFKPRPGLEV